MLRAWGISLALGVVAFAVLYPCDATLHRWFYLPRLGGDLKRGLETVQQFGDLLTLILTAVLIALLDPARRRRLADMFLASGAVALACNILKLGLGRPRPVLDAPHQFLFPWGTYPLPAGDDGSTTVAVHAWELGRAGLSNLWSMPSSHTAAAVALAVFLTLTYPRLRPLTITLAVLVGAARIILGAHYPSDVAVGAALAFPISYHIVARGLGQRLLGTFTPAPTGGGSGTG